MEGSAGRVPLQMTMGVYAGKEGLEAKLACVRAVKLPEPSATAV
jgi:hypothetical protein